MHIHIHMHTHALTVHICNNYMCITGEEDTHGYDLSRLPKPVDHGPTYRPDGPDRPYVRVDEPPIPGQSMIF